MDTKVVEPTYAVQFVDHEEMAKVKIITIDFMQAHLIPYSAGKKMMKEIYDALITLYQSVNVSLKMLLWNKFIGTHMSNYLYCGRLL